MLCRMCVQPHLSPNVSLLKSWKRVYLLGNHVYLVYLFGVFLLYMPIVSRSYNSLNLWSASR
uniref:Uncharacterized protein n=1 Tax=Arundo donax TaxID=35708 RepID=A0A0A9BUG2_ARUDO